MKTILLLRHGKSSWKDSNLADHDRPLKNRGKMAAKQIGKLISEQDIIPDQICCSTAKRARDTVKFLLETLHFDGEITFSRDLYHGYTNDYIDVLNNLHSEVNCVMVVGHNPGIEEFLSSLTDIDEYLPTAALAQVEIEIFGWNNLDEYLEGKLINLWRPRDL